MTKRMRVAVRAASVVALASLSVAAGCGRPRPSAARTTPIAPASYQPPTPASAPAALPSETDLSAARATAKARPRDAAAWSRLGGLCLAAGQLPEGAAALRRAASLDPTAEAPWRSLALVYESQRYLDRELDALNHMAALHTRDPVVYLHLAKTYFELYWMDRVPRMLAQAEAAAPELAAPRLWQARYDFQMRSTTQGIRELEDLQRQFPDDSEVARQLALDYLTVGRPADGYAVLQAALKRHPDDRLIRMALAYNCVKRTDSDHAAEIPPLLDPVAKAAPQDAEAWCWLGRAYERMGRTQDATAAYQQAYMDEPSFENVSLALGRLYMAQGKVAEGQRLMDYYSDIARNAREFSAALARISREPNSAAAHAAGGLWYMKAGVYPKAVLEYRRALELKPHDPAYAAGLRKALLASGRRTEAAEVRG